MKINILLHKGYGSFTLSQEALRMLTEMGWVVSEFNSDHRPLNENADILYKAPGSSYGYIKEGFALNWFKLDFDSIDFRTNNDLVNVVIELGDKAGNNIVIEELYLSDILFISDHDGYEKLEAKILY